MTADERIRRALETVVPKPAAAGDWERVLADAERPGRNRLALSAGAVAAAVTAVALVLLVAPLDERQPTFFEQALAAVGDGPVVHLVLRGDWGGAYLDLDSGKVTPVYGETEVWYDPDRGLREISLLGGKPQAEGFVKPHRIGEASLEQYQGLANNYREALASGRARVIADGEVEGRPVRWIRIHGEFLPDSADGKDHLFAHEVAVDRETHEPVYFRVTRDGRPGPRGTGQAIVKMELLPEGSGDFSRRADPRSGPEIFGARPGAELTVAEARRAFDRRALWLGPSFDATTARIQELEYEYRARPADPLSVSRSLGVFYGGTVRPAGIPGLGGTRVMVEQTEQSSPHWRGATANVPLPDGSAYVTVGSAVLRHQGLYVSIQAAPSTSRVIEALGALRPIAGGPAVAPVVEREGADRLAELVDQARPAPRVTGSEPVPPRQVKPQGPAMQTGSARGVTVRIHAPNIAVFDTSRVSPSVRRLLRGKVGYTCFRAANGSGGGGASARLQGRYVVRLTGRAPFDGCQISGTFGRRWGAARTWHAPVELALTAAGRRYFAERAAARELAYFVRSPAMATVRRALKRETGQAPPAADLAARFGDAAVGLATAEATPPEGKIGIWTDADAEIRVTKVVGGKILFVELREGRIAHTNVGRLAFVF